MKIKNKIKDPINQNLLCSTYKNKLENIQCPNKRKDNMFFCGKHKNIKDIIFDNNNNQVDIDIDIDINKNTEYQQDKTQTQNVQVINSLDEKKTDTDTNTNTYSNNNINNLLNINTHNISKKKILKNLEKNKYYNEYLDIRKSYIKNNTKYIELIDYIGNSNLDTYSFSRINASLEYYRIIKHIETSQFLQAIKNIEKLQVFFDILLKANKFLKQLIKLQRYIKKSLKLFKVKKHGPALNNRVLCVNDSDFFTLDEVKDIPNAEFFSFSDEKNFIYGFHIDSIIQLILKSDENYFEQFSKKLKHKNTNTNTNTNTTTNTNHKICYQQFIKLLYNHYSKIKIINPYTRFTIDNKIKLNAIRLYAQKEYDINKV